jgi:hypothetical protein
MATNNHNSTSSHSTTTSNNNVAAAKAPRVKTRKLPVAERMTVSAPVAVPPTPQAATPPVPPAPPATGPSGQPSPTAPSGGSGGSGNAGSGGSDPVGRVFPVSAPPPVTLPSVPNGFVPVSGADTLGFRVLASQAAAVPDAIAELQSFASYTAVFGITAPDVGQLTQRLAVAFQWTTLLSQTAAWYKYSKSQYLMAWKDALLLVDSLKAPFDLASTANPALLSQYPGIARLLGAKSIVAKRAAASRAKGKAAAAKTAATNAGAAAAQTPAPAQAPAVAAVPAVNGANGATANGAPAAAAARIVTVQG